MFVDLIELMRRFRAGLSALQEGGISWHIYGPFHESGDQISKI